VRRLLFVRQAWHLLCYLFMAAPMAWYLQPRARRSRLTRRERMSRYFWISHFIYTAENLKIMTEFNATQLKISHPFNRQIPAFSSFPMMRFVKWKHAVFTRTRNGMWQRLFLSFRDEISQTYVFTSLPPVIRMYFSRNTCLGQVLKTLNLKHHHSHF